MLTFSHEIINFNYAEKGHLQSQITVTNRSMTPIYFKFKVNRPRFYIVKPDRGLIHPNSAIDINIKLHREGIPQANGDKFKCFYTLSSAEATDQSMKKFQQRVDTQKSRFIVKVHNLPDGMDNAKDLPAVGSQLRSIGNSGANFISSSRMPSTTYQSVVREKQDRVNQLKSQIQNIQKSLRDRKIAEYPTKSGSSWVPLILTGVAGLALGVVTSLWF